MVLIESYQVKEIKSGTRLSDYIHHIFQSLPSRKSGKKAIKNGLVKVNGSLANTGIIVQKGMDIQLFKVSVFQDDNFLPSPKILYEDEYLIVTLKPAGIRTSGNSKDHLLARVQSAMGSQIQVKSIHRLDRATSGIVLFAKNTLSAAELSKQFREAQVSKSYTAIVVGEIAPHGSINLSIDGKDSFTVFTRIKVFPSSAYDKISMVRLFPKTGRKHQLRKHMRALNHPIVGDHLYGFKGEITKGKGMCLVASKISFKHPSFSNNMTIEIDLPKNFHKIIPPKC